MEAEDVSRTLVAGKYRLSRLLGRGGMGSVWEGVHSTLGTRVAVKFIESEHVNSPEARQRFENEARAAATLKSKHVVEVYDHGVMDDGRPFIVMEFLEGEPLDKRLDRVGRLHPKDTARIVNQVSRALAKAHAAKIVHRDLKPENIFLVWDDEDGADIAKVVDFGIAKFTNASASGSSSATRTGSVLGTPYYMSPEQARGLRSVDARSDLWSMGVIAYRCVVGSLPFEGEAIGDLLVKLCTAPIPVPSQVAPDVPPGFDAWLHKALMREPEHRFQSAQELAQSLAAVCGLSVRTGEMAIMPPSMQSGPYSAIVNSATTPLSANLQAAQVTGMPVSSTSSTQTSSKSKTGAILAGMFGALVVLAVGGLVVAKVLKTPPAAETTAAALPTTPTPAPLPIVAANPTAQPKTDQTTEVVAAPPPSAAPAASSAAPAPSPP
ncbi:MAG TPA: serine/threonine-protein kinase, partial [Polyangiaceae bacterium]|nr:serine/threonine-protein kinase [Polyangiaceae bacterium]